MSFSFAEQFPSYEDQSHGSTARIWKLGPMTCKDMPIAGRMCQVAPCTRGSLSRCTGNSQSEKNDLLIAPEQLGIKLASNFNSQFYILLNCMVFKIIVRKTFFQLFVTLGRCVLLYFVCSWPFLPFL